MEISFHGGNCIQINTKETKILIDPTGIKPPVKVDKKIGVVLSTHKGSASDKGEAFLVDGPGEYEVQGISVNGIAARSHMDEEGQTSATMYKIMTQDVYAVVVGHIHPALNDAQLEAIGAIDVLIVPIGGNGYTLDAVGAAKIIKKIEPKIVIPTHYKMSGVNYEVPQNELDEFLKEIGAGEHETTDKLKVKGELPEKLTVVELSKR